MSGTGCPTRSWYIIEAEHKVKNSIFICDNSSNHQYRERDSEHSLPADHLVLVVLPCKDQQRRLNDATTQPQHEVQGRLCKQTSQLTIAMAQTRQCNSSWHLSLLRYRQKQVQLFAKTLAAFAYRTPHFQVCKLAPIMQIKARVLQCPCLFSMLHYRACCHSRDLLLHQSSKWLLT